MRVYAQQNGWYKISSSAEHWVAGRYTVDVDCATVNASKLNVRSGPGTGFDKVGSYANGKEVWVSKTEGKWAKVGHNQTWVHTAYLDFTELSTN